MTRPHHTGLELRQWADDELREQAEVLKAEMKRLHEDGHGLSTPEMRAVSDELTPIVSEIRGRDMQRCMGEAIEELTQAGYSYSDALVALNID